MEYGLHVDDPVMGQPDRYRSDIAITIFLNSPQDYEGGELSVYTNFGPRQIKLEAGDGVMYPASSLHQVKAVISGERLVAVTWMQSMVRQAERRELLYQLYLALQDLRTNSPQSASTHKIEQSYVNLVRMWSEV